nr:MULTISPECIES: hypothetical protein [unclassified Bradyrhizobium]
MTHNRSLSRIFLAPLLVALVTSAGLVSALVGDGPWDAVSWLTLGFPIVLYVGFFWRRKSR